jgi:hypothetical protein
MSFLTLRGTLTLNQMTAHAVFYQGAWYERSGEGYWPHGVIWARCDGAPHPDRSSCSHRLATLSKGIAFQCADNTHNV